jgi:hypothetical protein
MLFEKRSSSLELDGFELKFNIIFWSFWQVINSLWRRYLLYWSQITLYLCLPLILILFQLFIGLNLQEHWALKLKRISV